MWDAIFYPASKKYFRGVSLSLLVLFWSKSHLPGGLSCQDLRYCIHHVAVGCYCSPISRSNRDMGYTIRIVYADM